MTRTVLFMACILLVNAGFSRQGNSPADSLRNALQHHPQLDSSRVLTLLNLSDQIVYDSAQAAGAYADTAMGISQQFKWQKGIALAWRQRGNVLYVMSKNTEAMDCFQRALVAG